ncbi:ABC transporter permease [Cohnella nanjingensis]|uniref:Transport permease protein n=1 Tax=Cohnella nanjingensis TaxID=1387779 RepID=A0A7X0RYW4_9BACL|nr:ABC transporter permease [Cohnella nanjingensis]MBB6675016.1 ABC transporter permease [Cohnella nanjingensis]
MNEILWLVRKTLRSTFRKKSSWLVFIGLPLIGVLVSMLLYGSFNGQPLRVGIVNADGDQALTQDAIQFIQGLDQVKITLMDDETLRSDIAAGKLDTGIRFGAGFGESLGAGRPADVQVLSVKGASVTAYVKAMLNDYLGNVASIAQSVQGDKAAFDRLYEAYRQSSFKVSAETLEDTSHVKDMTYQSLGFLIAFMMFSSVNLTELILKEKENRTFLRLLSSPVSARTYVLSNVLVNLFVIVIQIVATLFFMKNVFHIDSGIPTGELITVLLLFGLAAISLSLLIVAFAKTTASAGALSNLIVTPTCLLAGCYFPMDIMPDAVKRISNFLPQHWLLDTVNKLQHGEAFGSLYLNLAILLAFAAAFALIAIYRFGRNNDTRLFV